MVKFMVPHGLLLYNMKQKHDDDDDDGGGGGGGGDCGVVFL